MPYRCLRGFVKGQRRSAADTERVPGGGTREQKMTVAGRQSWEHEAVQGLPTGRVSCGGRTSRRRAGRCREKLQAICR